MNDLRATCSLCSRPVDRSAGHVYYPQPKPSAGEPRSVVHTDCGRAEVAQRRANLEPEGFAYRANWAPREASCS